jgi:hypothetical protein
LTNFGAGVITVLVIQGGKMLPAVIMIYGFPLDRSKAKLDEVAEAVRKGVSLTKSFDSFCVFFPQDLRGWDPTNGIVIHVNLDPDRTFFPNDCEMIRQGIRTTVGELLPDIKINVCFS